jgi:DNA-binding MarR family transcriptional regulator
MKLTHGNVATVSDVRWLDDDERRAWLALAGMVFKLPGALDAQLQEDSNLSFIEYMVLAMLGERHNRTMRMSDLAAMTNVSASRLSHTARRLESHGYITRCRDDRNARQINATLTDLGMKTVSVAAPGHVEWVRRLVIDALSPEQLGQLAEIGQAVMERVDPGWQPPAG